MSVPEDSLVDKHRELLVLALAPALILALTLTSWGLAHARIGPVFLNAGLALAAVLLGGVPRFAAGVRDLLRARLTVNVFVTAALAATVAIGEFRAAAVIIFIMAVVGALESHTLDKTRRAIRDLLRLTPPTATVRRTGAEITVPVSELRVGDIVVIRPGERIPVDGVVTAGAAAVNQAPITGESMPVDKSVGAEVFAGTLNETGWLDVRMVHGGADSTLARIVQLVEAAQDSKAPIQTLADRFTFWFFPTVAALAILAFLASGDVRVAVSVLLVACPCAFAIATPSAVSAGIANMARRAVLIKGGIYFELAGNVDTLLVDKTGTLTFGRPKVVDIVTADTGKEDEVLRLAASAEKYSEHPLAKAILAAAHERGLTVPDPSEFKAEVGFGVAARLDDERVLVGKAEFLRDNGIPTPPALATALDTQTARGHTVVLVSRGALTVGLLAVADEIRPETTQTVDRLKALGIRQIVMLTGDNHRVAQAVAAQAHMDDFRAGLLPEDKQRFVRELKKQGRVVAMVGDGINDAPALALADIGIVMGATGTHVAIEAADVTLMNDNLTRVADFIEMSRTVIRRIKLNIFLSIVYNAIGLLLGTVGLLTPVMAVLFQEAGCISVVLSSTLLLRTQTGKRS